MITSRTSSPDDTSDGLRVRATKRFFGSAERYLSHNYRIPIRSRIVRELVGDIHDSRILDLGCGDGSISSQFLKSNNRVTMVDFSADMLARAQTQVPAEFARRTDWIEADILQFEPTVQYDLVLCIGVLAHVESVDAAIQKISGMVKPGGRIVFQISDDERVLTRLSRRALAVFAMLGGSSLPWTGMTFSQVAASAERCGLVLEGQARHLLLFTGMAWLLGKWLIPYDAFTRTHPRLARHATNVIFICRKERRARMRAAGALAPAVD
jgi:2-polyprenyl-3-methyl-5-hydroxy-6-metoxy-1,4-benzoquinol methylase